MRWAALLKSINAGKTLPMRDLRAFLADQGMHEVATLLASGNAVFTADASEAAALEARLQDAARDALGLDTLWFLRSGAELKKVMADNPFADAADARPNHLQVFFHRAPVDKARLRALAAAYDGPERLHAIGRELYVDYPEGIGRSKLPPAMARAKFAAGTARNWNTLGKIIAAM